MTKSSLHPPIKRPQNKMARRADMTIHKRKSVFRFNAFNRHQWLIEKSKTVPAGSEVLDAGAGAGPYRHLFSHCNYKTQDFCQTPSSEGTYTEMDYVCDITDIPVPDRSFDVVICSEVLEHVPEPIKVIKEFSRILRPGGRLLLTAPQACALHQEPYIFYGGYTPYWYQRFLPEHGFENITIVPNCGFFKFYAQESRRFVRLLFPKDMGTLAKILTYPLKLIMSLWFRRFVPVLCHYLERFDKEKKFTVGYFVDASRKKESSISG